MKKIFLLVLAVASSLMLPVSFSAENSNVGENAFEKQTKQEFISSRQGQLIDKFEKELIKMDLTKQEVENVGDYFFKEDNLVIRLDLSAKANKKLDKLKKIANNLEESSSNQIIVENVTYTYDELVELQNEFVKQSKLLMLNQNYFIDLNSGENRLDLTIESLTQKNKEDIQKLFGSVVAINVDEEFANKYMNSNEAEKSRESDFNSLGAGIGIKYRQTDGYSYGCSIAGVAQKGTELWVMSAGHCNDNINSPFYQWDAVLGTAHLNATASDYDFLLIKVTGSGILRYASNGLYSATATTTDGYDSELKGSFTQVQGLNVCKVGRKTNKTCGVVTVARRRSGIFNEGLVTSVVENGGALLSKVGDSGGAWYTQSLPYRLVGIHQGGNKDLADKGSSQSYFTPWVEVADKYGLTLYTSTNKKPM